MMTRRIGLTVWVWAMCSALFGQHLQLPPAEGYQLADTQRVLDLNEEFKRYIANDPNRAQALGEEALALATTLQYTNGISKMSNNLGVLHSQRGNYEQALRYHRQNEALLRRVGRTHKLGNCHHNIGSVLYEKGDLDGALNEFRTAYEYFILQADTSGAAHVVNNVGNILMDTGELPEALDMFLRSVKLREMEGDSSQLAPGYLNVGHVYELQGRLDYAEGYYLRALNLAQVTDNHYHSVSALTSLSGVYGETNRSPEAFRSLRLAQRMATFLNDQYGLAEVQLGLAEEFRKTARYDSSEYYAREALAICRDIGRAQGEGKAGSILGQCLLAQGNPAAARVELEAAATIARQNGFQELARDNFRALSQAYAELGAYQDAYEAQREFFDLHLKIFSRDNNSKLLELQEQYQVGQQEQMISRLEYRSAQDELRIARGRLILMISITAGLLLLTIAGILLYRNRKKQQIARVVQEQKEAVEDRNRWIEEQNKQILEINNNLGKMVETRTAAVLAAKEELDGFLYQSAHALRRPVVRIEGLLSLLEGDLKGAEPKGLVEHMRVSLNDMDDLLHQLVTVNEVERRDPELEPVDLAVVVAELNGEIGRRGGRVELVGERGFTLLSDGRLLKILLSKAVENSVQYCEGPAEVRVLAANEGNCIRITVEDNGWGIPAGEEARVFEMFYRADHRSRGNGLGLYVVRKIADRLHGSARMEQPTSGTGARLVIELPPHAL